MLKEMRGVLPGCGFHDCMYAADFTSILHGKLEFSSRGGGTTVGDIWTYKVVWYKVGADVIVGENPSKIKGGFFDNLC